MSVEIAAWNAKKLLTDDLGLRPNPEGAKCFAEGIGRLDSADAIVLSEPFVTSGDHHEQVLADVKGMAEQVAAAAGYTLYHTPYEDADRTRPNAPVNYDHHMLVMGRSALISAGVVRLNTRNAFHLSLVDRADNEVIRGVGAHFDDRSEDLRLGMAGEAVTRLHDGNEPEFIIGDLNSLPVDGVAAQVFRSHLFRVLSEHLPQPRARDIAERLENIADGTTLRYLLNAGLQDADKHGRSTMYHGGRLPLGQFDHLLVHRLAVAGFRRHRLKGSDHRAISACLRVSERRVA